VQDGLLGEKGEAAEGTRVVLGELGGPNGCLRLEGGLEPLQDGLLLDVGIRALLLDRRLEPLEPALHHFEIGEDQLRLEIGDVALGIGRRPRRIGERAHHVKEGVGAPELLGVEPFPVALADPGEVHHLEGGEGGLLRLEEPVSRSTRSSGTRATPECISARAPPNEEVATEAPVRRLNSEVFPLLGSPTRPIFMPAHATIPPSCLSIARYTPEASRSLSSSPRCGAPIPSPSSSVSPTCRPFASP
jgi:hypothetical protein